MNDENFRLLTFNAQGFFFLSTITEKYFWTSVNLTVPFCNEIAVSEMCLNVDFLTEFSIDMIGHEIFVISEY